MGGEGVENKIERRFAQTLVRVVEREEHVEHGVAFIASEKRVVSTSDSDYESEKSDESNQVRVNGTGDERIRGGDGASDASRGEGDAGAVAGRGGSQVAREEKADQHGITP